ncbi:MAG: autotransporter domain-containing protein [Methylobacterium sp.]|nr:autotransporter domain-containing protein [Methylobacterium sp.]
MTITNSKTGLIVGSQSRAVTRTTSTATSFQGTVTLGDATSTAAASIGVAAGIYAEEEVQELIINNSGNITGEGTYASGIYTRAGSNEFTNSGTVSGTRIGVAQVSDSGEIRSMVLDNSGTINGDVMSVNGAALRWWSLSNGEGTGGATLDSRLNINSQYGQADSEITNSGTINGSLYFSNGTHVLDNEADGEITGNIDVDQRDTIAANIANTSLPIPYAGLGENARQVDNGNNTSTITTVGTKLFTFENAGAFQGNLTIRTATSTALPGRTVTSNILLVPTITGSGAGSSLEAPSSAVAGMGGTLKIYSGTAASDGSNSTAALATVAPKLATIVHQGEWFKVANTLYGATLPQISAENTPLVEWEIAKNAAGNLVVGVESAATATDLGIRGASGNALNALLAYTGNDPGLNRLGAEIQGMASVDEVEAAAEQLRPQINGAATRAAMGINNRVRDVVGQRISQTHLAALSGQSGIASGDQPGGTGVWLQGFGFNAEQDRRKGVDGFEADSFGFAVGADTLVGDTGDLRVGGALSYANSSIDDKGVNRGNRTDIDSYLATAYASKLMGHWYLNGALGLGRHDYDTSRRVVGNAVSGSYDAWQYSANIEAGYPVKAGILTLTPVASLGYSRLAENGYSEKGVGALRMNDRDTDSLRSGLGATVQMPLMQGEVSAGLELRAIWNHEFADIDQDSTARFSAGGTQFTSKGVYEDRDSANLGFSLRVANSDKDIRQSLLISYDAEIRDQYLGHTAFLQARFDF